MSFYQPRNFKYDLASGNWTELPRWRPHDYRLSFNLLPLIDNRFILVVSEDRPRLLDTKTDTWITLTQKGHRDLSGVQIGAFTLPLATRAFRTQASEGTTAFDDDDLAGKKADIDDRSENSSMEHYSDAESGDEEFEEALYDDDEQSDWRPPGTADNGLDGKQA